MMNPRETWGVLSSNLGRKKEIPHKTTYQRTSHSGNGMSKIMKTRKHIPEIILMVELSS